MNADIRKAIQSAETTLATELRVLASTLAIEQSAAELSEITKGYRRMHPVRSRLEGLPASLRQADTAMLMPLVGMLKDASPDVQRAASPVLRGRSLSEADALALRSVTVLDAALQNYRALAEDVENTHPLAGQWANKLRAAEDAHHARTKASGVVRWIGSIPFGIAAIGGLLGTGLNHILMNASSPSETERLLALAAFVAAIIASIAFAVARNDADEPAFEWPATLVARAIWAGAVPECVLLLRWSLAGELCRDDERAIMESLRVREAMLPDEAEDTEDEADEDAGNDSADPDMADILVHGAFALSTPSQASARRLPLSALPPVPEDRFEKH